jgi:hypothetical protein
MDAFANMSTLAFLKAYCGENIHVVDNKYQPHVGEGSGTLYQHPLYRQDTLPTGHFTDNQVRLLASG